MTDSDAERLDAGFYWIRWPWGGNANWQPAEYRIDAAYYEPYWKIQGQQGFIVGSHHFAEIGPRLHSPPEIARLRSQAAPIGDALERVERARIVAGRVGFLAKSPNFDEAVGVVAAAITVAEREATERAYDTLDHRLKTFIAGAEFNKETIGAQTADELLAALSLVLMEYPARGEPVPSRSDAIREATERERERR